MMKNKLMVGKNVYVFLLSVQFSDIQALRFIYNKFLYADKIIKRHVLKYYGTAVLYAVRHSLKGHYAAHNCIW